MCPSGPGRWKALWAGAPGPLTAEQQFDTPPLELRSGPVQRTPPAEKDEKEQGQGFLLRPAAQRRGSGRVGGKGAKGAPSAPWQLGLEAGGALFAEQLLVP